MEAFADTDDHRSAVGRLLLTSLLDSDLATIDDRSLVEALLDIDATVGRRSMGNLRVVLPAEVDDVLVVIDDEHSQEPDGDVGP